MRALMPLLFCAAAWAGDVADQMHLVKIATDRGDSKQILSGSALCVGENGLFLAVGFALDKPQPERAHLMAVTVVTPDGKEYPAQIVRGHDDMNCTFFRQTSGPMPEPVPLAGVPVNRGDRVRLLARHGALLEYALFEQEAAIEAVVSRPRTVYALKNTDPARRGCLVATREGRLVGFVDGREPFPGDSGLVLGVGSTVMVAVPAADYVELLKPPPAKAWLGVNLAPFDERREDYFNVGADMRGALVTGITKGSPADKAGVKVHDLLQRIGQFGFYYERAPDWEKMLRGVQRLPLDVPLECRVVRFTKGSDGSFVATPVKLEIVMSLRPTDFADAQETEIEDLGMHVKPVTDDWSRINKVPPGAGAVVARIKRASAAALAGLGANDLILAVDRAIVVDPKGLVELLAAAKKAKRAKVVLMVRRGAATAFLTVEPGW